MFSWSTVAIVKAIRYCYRRQTLLQYTHTHLIQTHNKNGSTWILVIAASVLLVSGHLWLDSLNEPTWQVGHGILSLCVLASRVKHPSQNVWPHRSSNGIRGPWGRTGSTDTIITVWNSHVEFGRHKTGRLTCAAKIFSCAGLHVKTEHCYSAAMERLIAANHLFLPETITDEVIINERFTTSHLTSRIRPATIFICRGRN